MASQIGAVQVGDYDVFLATEVAPRQGITLHLVICGRGCWRRVPDPTNPTPARCPRHRRDFRVPGPNEPAPCDACLTGRPDKHTGVGCYGCVCGCGRDRHGIGGQGPDLAHPKRHKRGRGAP